MKVAILSDFHLGYSRFEDDSYNQAEKAILDASSRSDIILCAGDIFDVKIPKLETLMRAVEIFDKSKVPVVAIHGNHERRTKDTTNPVQLLSASTSMALLHGKDFIFEKDGETLQVFGMGSVPEEFAEAALKSLIKERFRPKEGALRILMIHQSIKELIAGSDDEELSLEYLETLPFDLIVDGHIHETVTRNDGRFLIPGSTVITQLKDSETAPKGYFLYDTKTKKSEFVRIDTRKFYYEKMKFVLADETTIRDAITKKINGLRALSPDSLIAIKIEGTLKKGLTSSDIQFDSFENVFIENNLDSESLVARLDKIKEMRQNALSVRELALKELAKKTEGSATMFDSSELFEKLVLGVDETIAYLEERNKKEAEAK